MLPMKALRLELGTALAADAAILAPVADNNEIALIAASFSPSENLAISDLVLATFTGLAPKLAGLGTQNVGIDPATQQQSITIKEPIGGWRFQCTVTPSPPQTIYGFCLTTKNGVALLGVEAFPVPITITEAGNFVEIGFARLTFVLQPMS